MANREEVLASMRAPTPQGLDMRQVLQSLAGAAAQGGPSTSWGYGMRVDDAQREGALAAQHQKEKSNQVQQTMGNALQQDEQLFNRAMQAHAQVMRERQMALSEEAHAVEMQYKRAQLSKLPLELEAAQLQADRLRMQVERDKRMSELTVPVRMGEKTMDVPMDIISSMNQGQLGALGISSNPKIQQYQRDYENYLGQGYSDIGAHALARDPNPSATMLNLRKIIDQAEKNRKGVAGIIDYGQVDDGKGGKRSVTREEWYKQELSNAIRTAYPGMDEKDYAKLFESITGAAQAAPSQEDLLLRELERGFINRYSQPR